MTAFYNEIDPFAAQWLRNLIEAGHIASGVVDERPIQEIESYELSGYTQCHFFAGIGVWSRALRDAGWSDDRPIWTGSCPCQPFSNAGEQQGFFDARHLWPHWVGLIKECRPPIIVGEQVAGALAWLDLVQTDLEASDYAFGACDLCAAGFEGAHIRQRLYFIALGNGDDTRLERRPHMFERSDQRIIGPGSLAGGVEYCNSHQSPENTRNIGEMCGISEAECESEHGSPLSVRGSGISRLEYDKSQRWGRFENPAEPTGCHSLENDGRINRSNAPMLGRAPVDWLRCTDGKWRPVEPGTFPLAHETSARVGRLRAYGNALDLETAAQFCSVIKEISDGV